jgi:O-antigen/teichoic acid export membrane protein
VSDALQVRAARWRNILLGGASAGAARAVGIGCNLLLVPLALALLGTDGFGLWATLLGLASFAGMLDLGTGYRLQNYAAESAALGQHAQIHTGLRLTLCICVSVAAVASLLSLAIGSDRWATLLGIGGTTLQTTLGHALPWLTGLCTLVLPANLGLRLASGLQRNWLVGASQAAASVAALAWVAAGGTLKLSPALLLAGMLLPPILTGLGLLWMLARWLPTATAAGDATAISPRLWLRTSLPFFVPQLSGGLRTAAPPLIIATLLGAAAVTPFNLIQRLLHFLSQPQQWLLDPMWSAYTDAASRRDRPWIERGLLLSLVASAAFVATPMLSALWWGPHFLEWWTAFPAASIPAGLMLWLTLWQVGIVLTQPLTICLNGLGRMLGQAIYGPPCTIAGLAGMVWLGTSQGLGPAAAPPALATLFANLPCAWWDVRLALRRLPGA